MVSPIGFGKAPACSLPVNGVGKTEELMDIKMRFVMGEKRCAVSFGVWVAFLDEEFEEISLDGYRLFALIKCRLATIESRPVNLLTFLRLLEIKVLLRCLEPDSPAQR